MKHSALSFANVGAFANMGLECFIGDSRLMLPALTIGATGCIDGPLCVAPELWVEIRNAYDDGDMERAKAAQKRGSDFAAVVVEFGLHATTKAILSERLGIDCGTPRPPGLPLTPEERSQVMAKAAALGLVREAAASTDN